MSEKSPYDSYHRWERPASLASNSGIPIKELYDAADTAGHNGPRDLGVPGEYPFTRGPYPGMYRTRTWTQRNQVGFGGPEETNERMRYLLEHGATGFIVTLDLPSEYAFDSDHPVAEGEVGVVGVAISTLGDMERLYDGFGPDMVSCAFSTPGGPCAAVNLAMIATVAERRGIPYDKLVGTQHNDPLYQLSGGPLQTTTQYFPLDGILRLVVDNIEFLTQHMPKLNWMVSNLYNLRETGVTAVQEIAFGLSHAFDVFRLAQQRGLDINQFARRASFFCSSSIDFFEEVAKFRAMRRIYARTMRERFGATNPECWRFRTSAQSAGNTYTTQQPLNNVIRGTVEAMAAVMGGVQSIHLSAYDEGLGLPTEQSALLSVRTQQVVASESGITRTVDPLAGSYYVESLTQELETRAEALIAEVESRGGLIECVRSGWLENQIRQARSRNQAELDEARRILVGVNRYQIPASEEPKLEIHKYRVDEWSARRAEYLRRYREDRDQAACRQALGEIRRAWAAGTNMVPVIMDALRAGATRGEISDAMRAAQGFTISVPGEV